MYAIVETGGKQYKVAEGDLVKIERINANIGDKVNLDVVLLVNGDKVTTGAPYVNGSQVVAEVVSHGKAEKILVFKYKAKKNERKTQGHRQPYTELKIVSVK